MELQTVSVTMCETAMPQINNHNLILNEEECTSQESQQHLLAHYSRGVLDSGQMQHDRLVVLLFVMYILFEKKDLLIIFIYLFIYMLIYIYINMKI